MAQVTFQPPFTSASDVAQQLRQSGYAVLSPLEVTRWVGCDADALCALSPDWNSLPPDDFLKDGGRYRRRRHACFVVQGTAVQQVPHRAHWQPIEYNALHGGMERWFAPMDPATVSRPVWQQVLGALAKLSDVVFSGVKTGIETRVGTDANTNSDSASAAWFVEAHQFRIDTTDGIGRPTPEGAHRDGVDLVAVFLVAREGVKGGETRVFEADGPNGQRFTLAQPWSLLLLDDARMIHESTPIQPLADAGHRDTLVVTCRRHNFQGADTAAMDPQAPPAL